jgi:hypothetical protein
MLRKLPIKQIISWVIIIAVAVNIFSFCVALPQILKPESPSLARDFSAYYTGAYRLLHNPTKIYYDGVQPGDYPIFPHPQPFKYTPSFLILFAPLLTMKYLNALAFFDILQIGLVPILAFFVYELVKSKNLFLAGLAAVIVLIEPLPAPAINIPPAPLVNLWLFNITSQSFTPSYYSAYLFVNAHVLQTVLLVGALYLGSIRKPWISALLFTFGLLDPRAAIVAIPLLLWYNRYKLRQFVVASAVFTLATNLPFFFYHNIGSTFLLTEMNTKIVGQSYVYDWIPFYAVSVLTIAELSTVILTRRKNTIAK